MQIMSGLSGQRGEERPLASLGDHSPLCPTTLLSGRPLASLGDHSPLAFLGFHLTLCPESLFSPFAQRVSLPLSAVQRGGKRPLATYTLQERERGNIHL